MNSHIRDYTATASWTPISSTSLGFSGTLTAHQTNASALEIRELNAAFSSTLLAGEFFEYTGDLARIEIKGNSLILKAQGNQDAGWR